MVGMVKMEEEGVDAVAVAFPLAAATRSAGARAHHGAATVEAAVMTAVTVARLVPQKRN